MIELLHWLTLEVVWIEVFDCTTDTKQENNFADSVWIVISIVSIKSIYINLTGNFWSQGRIW